MRNFSGTTAASTAVTQVSSDGLPNTSDRYARIMTFNTKEGHADANRIVEIVKNEHVEVLALQEVSWDLLNRLNSALMLVCARIRYVTDNEWSTRRYLDMSRLDDTLQAAN